MTKEVFLHITTQWEDPQMPMGGQEEYHRLFGFSNPTVTVALPGGEPYYMRAWVTWNSDLDTCELTYLDQAPSYQAGFGDVRKPTGITGWDAIFEWQAFTKQEIHWDLDLLWLMHHS